ICKETESLVRQFIWGSSNGKRKLALINRESVCHPLSCGCLGLRRLEDQNVSFLMKLGFCLVTNINALWVKVLRSKYRLKDNLPESIMANNGSFLSKVLLKIWPLFRDNLICSVGMEPNSKGNFPVKSAYWSPKEDYWNPKDPIGKLHETSKALKEFDFCYCSLSKNASLQTWRVIWKNINLFVFQGSTWEATEIIKVPITWAEQFWITHNEALNRILTIAQRNSPLGILDGLTLLQDRGLNKISIHTDRLKIQQRLRNFEHWVVRHVPREANLVVDRIANMVVVDMEGVNVLEIAPTDLLEALQSDKDNGPFDCT
ncbi:hypothetical protein Goarm_016876, partial [Gossypium armourianum]|nr:hypothetical protein [Gossypium armourianum]